MGKVFHIKPDTVLSVGKYTGYSIEEIVQVDVQYIDWMMRTWEDITWDDEVGHLVSRQLDR